MMRKLSKSSRCDHLSIIVAGFLLTVLMTLSAPAAGNNPPKLVPELAAGQVLRYDIRGHVQQHKKTESRVIRNVLPQDVKQDFSKILRITVETVETENGKPVISAVAEFEYSQDKAVKPDENAKSARHLVEFTIGGNGQLKSESGLDELSPVEALAFTSWISKFAFGWTIPGRNMKPGEVWKSEEPENTPGPIARLVWERTTTYGQSTNCPVLEKENCAVFLTTAILNQKSSVENSTPEDYKLHDLKTSGMAKGKNETYDSISSATGLLMRGTEDVQQSMEVVIAKSDGSNDVKYTIEAGSHFEMLFVSGGAEK
jgi:hypothetical protein